VKSNFLIGIIFSKDRALQLDATLHSFFLHCQDPHLISVKVIFLATNARIEKQYQSLAQDYPNVNFIRQSSFRENILNIILPAELNLWNKKFYRWISELANLIFDEKLISRVLRHFFQKFISPFLYWLAPASNKPIFILFVVDDNLFIRDFSLAIIMESLQNHKDALGFSLRLGKNTKYSYALRSEQKLPLFEYGGSKTLIYHWPKAQYDFSYPLEVSSSVYRIEQIMPLLASIPFRDPNTLEGEIASRRDWFAHKFPRLLCFKISVTFCNPINIVQNVASGNRVGENIHYSVDDLFDRFEHGERVDVLSFNDFVPNSCHQEVELKFKKIGGQ